MQVNNFFFSLKIAEIVRTVFFFSFSVLSFYFLFSFPSFIAFCFLNFLCSFSFFFFQTPKQSWVFKDAGGQLYERKLWPDIIQSTLYSLSLLKITFFF